MTRKLNFKKAKTILATILTLLFVVCSCLFCFTACKSAYTADDPTYSYTEVDEDDDSLIVNSSFDANAEDKDISSLPYSSVNGWTFSVDNKAVSSAVSSGMVSVDSEAWVTEVKTLLEDSDFINYIKNRYSSLIIADIISKDSESDVTKDTLTSDQIKEYVENNIETVFKNPAKHDAEIDNYVYMINNYSIDEDYKFGTAQSLTAYNDISLEDGKAYKISVWVKTYNITGNNPDGFGANIRLKNTFNNNSQAEYRISNINTDGEWVKYTICVQGDKDFTCNVDLILGLGYGNGGSSFGKDYVEGTVYFDDISIEEIDRFSVCDCLQYGSDEPIEGTKISGSDNTYAYDMTLSADTNYLKNYKFKLNPANKIYSKFGLTKSNVSGITSEDITPLSEASFTPTENSLTFNLTKASYTANIALEDLGSEEYIYMSFYIDNQLDAFGSTDITVNVIDKLGDNVTATRHAVATFSTTGEKTLCQLMIKNNFYEKDYNDKRSATVQLVFGPEDISSVKYASELATGTVIISNVKFATGKTYQYVRTAEYEDTDVETDNYALYQLFSQTADATVALYAGYAEDYSEVTEEGTTYDLEVAPANIGTIVTEPTNVNGYAGITSNHIYINKITAENKDTINKTTNGRIGTGDADGNVAGLINTKYTYSNLSNEVKEEIAKLDSDIQPIMIYNKVASSYGYIGSSTTLSASANAHIQVKLKVVGDAKAYIYIVDTQTENNDILTFANIDNTTRSFMTKVDKDMMDASGWATVDFYIGNGNTERDYRVEVWNGSRDGANASTGFVFIQSITNTASNGFSEPDSIGNAFSDEGNPLYDLSLASFKETDNELISYTRPLTDTEVKFNNEYPDDAVSYDAKYVWAKTDLTTYGIFNNIEVTEVDPYDSLEEDDDEDDDEESTTDSSTFWLGFSSILLAVVIVLALIALFIKTFKRKHTHKKDTKINYQVKSRIATHKENMKAKEKANEKEKQEDSNEKVNEEVNEDVVPIEEEPSIESLTEEEKKEETLDDYVYGEVADFGETETNAEPTTEVTEETSNDDQDTSTSEENK